MERVLNRLAAAVPPRPEGRRERWLAAVGGLLGIAASLGLAPLLGGGAAGPLLVSSMGASAVLLFAAPHSLFASPWALLGGHLLSALVGVACASLGLPVFAAAPLAVGLAILVMHHARCLHPPGGGTALFAVVGMPAAGWGYVVAPVLVNALALLATALLFNRLVRLHREPPPAAPGEKCTINHSDLVYALSAVTDFLDVEEDDLVRIYRLAMRHHLGLGGTAAENEPGSTERIARAGRGGRLRR